MKRPPAQLDPVKHIGKYRRAVNRRDRALREAALHQ